MPTNATTGSVTSPAPLRVPGILARLVRFLTSRHQVSERPAIRWATDFRPIDWAGENTSLTQEHLELLR